jgi:hypothetical protein
LGASIFTVTDFGGSGAAEGASFLVTVTADFSAAGAGSIRTTVFFSITGAAGIAAGCKATGCAASVAAAEVEGPDIFLFRRKMTDPTSKIKIGMAIIPTMKNIRATREEDLIFNFPPHRAQKLAYSSAWLPQWGQ